VLDELGIDLRALRAKTPCVVGNPTRFRLLFKAPGGIELTRKVLAWPGQNGGKPVTVFELRGGQIQDVLPPTIHPETNQPYRWDIPPRNGFPPLLSELLELWAQWDSYRRELEGFCPWGKAFEPSVAPRGNGARPDIIGGFNEAHSVEALLERHGYKPKGRRRWTSPTSSTGLAGVALLDDGKVFSHHASDPLADEHIHDAFDVYRILKHGGDMRAAIQEAAKELGIELKHWQSGGRSNQRIRRIPSSISVRQFYPSRIYSRRKSRSGNGSYLGCQREGFPWCTRPEGSAKPSSG
jgi:putative DNA primase/helicase